jgi:hypothetical protein
MQLLIAAVLIEAALVCLVNMAGSVVESILLLLLVQTVYLFAVYRVFEHGTGQRLLIIPAALVFRITVAPLPAPFTDDLNRYRWEARVQDSGLNPYESRPADPQLRHLQDSTYDRIPGRDFKAAYGPIWEFLSLWTLRLTSHWAATPQSQLLWFKLPSALFDVATIGALSLLLRVRRLPASRILVYAWAPLPIWEFWANGHNDAVVLFFVTAALALAAKAPKQWAAGFMLGLAIATKWWPAILLPAFSRNSRSLRPMFVSTAVVVFAVLPFLTDVTENSQFMTGFVGGWRNNDSLFGLFLYITNDPYRAKYLAFSLIAICALWLATRDWPLERISLWTIAMLLLLSANSHPWYLTWMIPLLAFYPHPSLLLWVSLAPLAHQVQIDWQILSVWNGSASYRWAIYIPVFAVMGWEVVRNRRILIQKACRSRHNGR